MWVIFDFRLNSEKKSLSASHKTLFASFIAFICSHVRLSTNFYILHHFCWNFQLLNSWELDHNYIGYFSWLDNRESFLLFLLFPTFSCQLTETICSLLHRNMWPVRKSYKLCTAQLWSAQLWLLSHARWLLWSGCFHICMELCCNLALLQHSSTPL